MRRPSLGRVDRFDIVLIGTVLVLGGATVALLAFPAILPRVVSPALDLALDTVATVVTSLVTVLAWIRYCERRAPFALFQSAAFLVLAIANMHAVLGTIGPDLRAPLLPGEPGQDQLYVFTFARLLAAALLVFGGVASLHGWNPSHPLAIVVLPGALTVVAILLLTINAAFASRAHHPGSEFGRRGCAVAARRDAAWDCDRSADGRSLRGGRGRRVVNSGDGTDRSPTRG